MNNTLFQTAIGFSITAKCPIKCDHCIIEAGPLRREEMNEDLVVQWVRESSRYLGGKIKTTIITGGEPFYSPPLLKTVLGACSDYGLISLVVTNGFWASSVAKAEETLKNYPEISILSFSTDVYHRRYIPTSMIKNGITAAKNVGIPFNIAICAGETDEFLATLKELEGFVEADQLRIASVLPAGRGRLLSDDTFTDIFEEDDVEEDPGICFGAESPIIFPDGRLFSCMGITRIPCGEHPLQPGNVTDQSVDALLAGDVHNSFLHAMRHLGKEYIIRSMDMTFEEKRLLEKYEKFGSCSLCYAMASELNFQRKVVKRVSETDYVNNDEAIKEDR